MKTPTKQTCMAHMHTSWLRILMASLCMLAATSTWATNITASVSRNPVTVDESFSLILKAEGEVSGEPDLSPLKKDFDILGTSQSTNMSIVNGKVSRSSTWTVDLIGKEVGVLTIPSIRFGQHSSPSLRITIKDQASGNQPNNDSPISIEVSTDKQQVWQQAQLIVEIKLYHNSAISNASLSELETSDPYAIIEKLGEDNQYEMVRNGVRLGVIERKYAVFPQTAGKLTIKPLRFEARIGAARRSFFDPLVRGSLKRVRSKPIEISVRPVPAGIDAGEWLPADKLLVKEEWSADTSQLHAGEPVTRTITLVARGMLASQLPDITLPQTKGIKYYPDKPVLNSKTDGNSVVASKQIKIAVIPAYGGRYTLPAIRIPWWNTRTGKPETATLPATTLEVSGAAKPATDGNATPAPATTKADNNTARDNTHTMSTKASETQPATNYWPWISLALAAGWTLTLAAWLRSRTQTNTGKPASASRLKKQLLQACDKNDAAACKTSLLAWARAHWPQHRIHNLMDITRLVDKTTADAIRQLNASLYSEHAGQWRGDQLARALRQHKAGKKRHQNDTSSLIEPLYKS